MGAAPVPVPPPIPAVTNTMCAPVKASGHLGAHLDDVLGHRLHRRQYRRTGAHHVDKAVDTLLIIPNQNLFRVANEKTTFTHTFALADQVLYSGVACISDLVVKEGLINLDFADVLAVMREKGKAMMGRGEASGEKRVLNAAVAAISNPLIEIPRSSAPVVS